MKKTSIVIIFITYIIFIVLGRPVLAADATKSAAQDLLDRVATKVATLTERLRKVYIGDIKSVGTKSYAVTTSDGDRTITTNDVTSFYRLRAGNRTEVNFASIKKGDTISAIGTIDPNTLEMTAKQIVVKIRRFNVVGTISKIEGSVVSIQEINGPTTMLDFEDLSNLKKFSPKNQLVSVKLNELKAGDLVFAIAFSSDTSPDTPLSVLKAIVLPK